MTVLVLFGVLIPPLHGLGGEAVQDSCVGCHANADFLVRNKKLYDYYQDWELSVHRDAGVTCSDCHGGDPAAPDKEAAHQGRISESEHTSTVSFQNIPETCGHCHEDILAAYRSSLHSDHLVTHGQERQGPNCVTCHGSMAVSILDETNVEAACARCHNRKTQNHPEVPGDAREILDRFLSINRLHRYISVRLEPDEAGFLEKVDARMDQLAIQWHTFDLCSIDRGTRNLVELLRDKRQELRRRSSQQAAR
jgi:hypothetical protein